MANVLLVSYKDINFKAPDGKLVDGVRAVLLFEDGAVENVWIDRDEVDKVGFKPEMKTDVFNGKELNILDAQFVPKNGKLRLVKLSE